MNMHVKTYQNSRNPHIEDRAKKLLLHKREIQKLGSWIKESGIAIIPIEVYITEKGLIKVTICVAKGKKIYDKRKN